MARRGRLARHGFIGVAIAAFFAASSADAALRVVTYNIDADTDRNNDGVINATDATLRVDNVVSAIKDMGGYTLAGRAQPVDVVALQELFSVPSTTLGPIVQKLNEFYGAGTYAFDPLNLSNGNGIGNGPSGLIYNTKTVRVQNAAAVGTLSTQGAARYPIRYQLQATQEAGANSFYLYTQHAKAGSEYGASNGTTNGLRRTYELDAVRADADTLGAAAHVIYTGDLNLTGGAFERGYADLTAAPGTVLTTNGRPGSLAAPIVAGPAQAVDPLTNFFTSYDSAYAKYYTEASDYLYARLDYQFVTANAAPGSLAPGLQLIANTYTAFGNSYYDAGGNLASINGYTDTIATAANAAAVGLTLTQLQNLITATDHLPVIADYAIVVPEPAALGVVLCVAMIAGGRRRTQRPKGAHFDRGETKDATSAPSA